jgi:hypothetical protein
MNVYQKLNAVQCKLKAPKSQYNSFGKYNYRNCEDILEALKPILAEVGATIFITDSIEKVDERYYVKATVCFVDSESDGMPIMASAYAREEDTKKGMDGSQVTGASSSYARKYALNGLFAIDDTKDSDFTSGVEAPKQTKATSKVDEAFDSNIKYATSEQITYLKQAYNDRLGEFLQKAGVSDIKLLPFDVAEGAVAKLKEYYAKKNEQKGA